MPPIRSIRDHFEIRYWESTLARILLIIESADYVADETAGYASRGLCTPVESNAKKRDEGANRANWAREHSRRSVSLQSQAADNIGGSRAIIDITCHVNIGYRRLPNLSAEKGSGRQKGSANANRR